MNEAGPPEARRRALLERAPWLPTLGAAALAVALMGGAVFLHPVQAQLGSAYTEAPGHLWGLWNSTEGLWTYGPFRRVAPVGYPEGFDVHLMDPINLALFAPIYALAGGGPAGAALAWNGLHAGAILLGALGCWTLGRRLAGDHPSAPWAIALMTLVFCASPYLLSLPFMGRTEYLPAVLYPLHLALLHRWLRRPVGTVERELAPAAPLWVGLAAGASLGAAALGGWYLAIFLALFEVPLALGLSTRLPWGERLLRLGLVAALASAMLVPAALALIQHPPDGVEVSADASLALTGNYAREFFLEQLRVPMSEPGSKWMDQTAYVGLLSLALGLVGAVFFPRRAPLWLGAVAWGLLLAPGPTLVLSQGPIMGGEGTRLPAWYLMTWFAPLRAIHNWSRIAVVLALPAAVGALYGGLAVLPKPAKRATLVGLVLCGLALADQATWPSRYQPDRPSFSLAAPEDLLAVLAQMPPGPILQFPLDIPHRRGGPEVRGRYLLWQLQHGRPIPSTPATFYDTSLKWSVLSRLAATRQVQSVLIRQDSVDPDAPADKAPPPLAEDDLACARADVIELAARGFTGVTFQSDLTGASDLGELLTGALGPPTVAVGRAYGWTFTRLQPFSADEIAAPGSCTLPAVPQRVRITLEEAARREREAAAP